MNKLRNKFDNPKRIALSLILFSLLSISAISQETDKHIDNCKKYMMEQKYSEALEECQILFQSNLDSTNTGLIYAFAGIAYKELGESNKALEHLKTSIQYKVPRYDIFEMFIALANEQNDDDNYEFGLIEESKAFPDLAYIVDPKLLNHYLKTKNYEKLVEYANKCLESNPKEISYLYYSAFGYQKLNQLDKAENYYLSVLEIDPNHTNANLSLGNLYYKNV